MIPIVNGLKQAYQTCLTVDHVNFHADTPLHQALRPFGSPEFILLDAAEAILYRWFGRTERAEFDDVLGPLCG